MKETHNVGNQQETLYAEQPINQKKRNLKLKQIRLEQNRI
jgi:hypothetical protein